MHLLTMLISFFVTQNKLCAAGNNPVINRVLPCWPLGNVFTGGVLSGLYSIGDRAPLTTNAV